ncbi:MAG: NAD(P)H-quinone oxidoreductase subunit I [Syntrophorhabdus sp. PtaU1.Bin050]|nr:MAG: NAD(P)H-quinone oxidoreductase subunit I [Syntrophorhabdus sp. PtaU1.Bin050]
MRSFTMTKTIIKNLLGGPATLMYPKKKRVFTEITRGRVETDIHKCIFCGMCSRRCPTYAITVTKDSREWQIDRLKCCACNLCVEICPVKCLSMENQYASATTDKAGGIVTVRLEDTTGGT